MNLPRISVAGLLVVVGLFAVGLTCLLYASSPWASVGFSALLSALTLAPIGVVYRRGERRAFWLGVALCGWSYAVLGLGPWFADSIRPQLVTTRVLRWAHPIAIPRARRVTGARPAWSTFQINSPIHGRDIDMNSVHGGTMDVLLQQEGKDRPSPLVENVAVVGSGGSIATIRHVTIMTDAAQIARLEQA